MKVNDAIAIMNDEGATIAQLTDAEETFRAAGLKGLLHKVQATIGQRNRPVAPVDYGAFQNNRFVQAIMLNNIATDVIGHARMRALRALAREMILAKCERVVAEYERSFYNPDANPE